MAQVVFFADEVSLVPGLSVSFILFPSDISLGYSRVVPPGQELVFLRSGEETDFVTAVVWLDREHGLADQPDSPSSKRSVDLVEKPCCGRSLTEPRSRPKVSNLPGDLRSGVSAGSGDPRRTRETRAEPGRPATNL